MNDFGTTTTRGVDAKPVMQWVTVRDSSGRPHLEMRWSIAGAYAPLSRAA
ncbi:hypothetical protein [Kineococcus sp. SYSU DK003]